MSTDSDDNRLVSLKLGEIRRIRDALQKERDRSNLARQLWVQVAGLYQRLQKQGKETVA
jgi:transcriptional regulator with PAS, ATPase and Fis domain